MLRATKVVCPILDRGIGSGRSSRRARRRDRRDTGCGSSMIIMFVIFIPGVVLVRVVLLVLVMFCPAVIGVVCSFITMSTQLFRVLLLGFFMSMIFSCPVRRISICVHVISRPAANGTSNSRRPCNNTARVHTAVDRSRRGSVCLAVFSIPLVLLMMFVLLLLVFIPSACAAARAAACDTRVRRQHLLTRF